MTDRTNWKAPCVLCGYNGPGFFQPSTHPCAAHDTERDALVAELALLKNARDDYRTEVERLREALDAVMDACDPECYGCGAYYVAKKARRMPEVKP